jgi:hypothetical protein
MPPKQTTADAALARVTDGPSRLQCDGPRSHPAPLRRPRPRGTPNIAAGAVSVLTINGFHKVSDTAPRAEPAVAARPPATHGANKRGPGLSAGPVRSSGT